MGTSLHVGAKVRHFFGGVRLRRKHGRLRRKHGWVDIVDIAVTGAVKLCLGKSVDDADEGRKLQLVNA